MNRAAVSVLMLVVIGASCSDDPDPGDPGLPWVTFDMKTKVAPGEELHVCQFVRMPESAEEIFVAGGVYETSEGTHHFLLFRTDPDMPEQKLNEPVDCYEGDGVMQYERGFVSGGQEQRETADFPSGLALPFRSGEVLLMQSHIVNASAAEVEATAHVELRRIEPEHVDERVGTLRFYNPFIYVPAGGSARAAMRCPIDDDVKLLSAGAHMHARGVAYRAFADLPGAPADEPFYGTTDWQHPDYHIGVVDLPAGSALRFECDYDNPSADVFVQGLSATSSEMCMLSAFYYPAGDEDLELCAGMDMHGTGARSCAQTNSCIQLCDPADAPKFSAGRADVGECFQRCIVDSCPNVTGLLFPQLTCSAQSCAEECSSYGAACSACVLEHCKPELDACQALSCDP